MVEFDEATEDPPKLGRNLREESFGGSGRPREESRLRMGRRPAPPTAFHAGAVEGASEIDVIGSAEYVHNSRHAPEAAFAAPARRLYVSASASASESESASASAPELPPENAGGRPAGGGLERRGFGRAAAACGSWVISRTGWSGGLGETVRPAVASNGGVIGDGDVAPARGNRPRDTAVPSPSACELGDPRRSPCEVGDPWPSASCFCSSALERPIAPTHARIFSVESLACVPTTRKVCTEPSCKQTEKRLCRSKGRTARTRSSGTSSPLTRAVLPMHRKVVSSTHAFILRRTSTGPHRWAETRYSGPSHSSVLMPSVGEDQF